MLAYDRGADRIERLNAGIVTEADKLICFFVIHDRLSDIYGLEDVLVMCLFTVSWSLLTTVHTVIPANIRNP